MERIDIEHQVTEIVRRVLLIEANKIIDPQKSLTILGMDSLKALNVLVELEMTFDTEYSNEELMFEHFETIDKMVETLMKKNSIQYT